MSIKLLAAALDTVDASQASDGSRSLVSVSQRAITARGGQISLVPSGDAFAWSSSGRRGQPNRIYGTVVEDSGSDGTEDSGGEYVSGSAWSRFVESTAAVAHYLSYATASANWSGRLINLYA